MVLKFILTFPMPQIFFESMSVAANENIKALFLLLNKIDCVYVINHVFINPVK